MILHKLSQLIMVHMMNFLISNNSLIHNFIWYRCSHRQDGQVWHLIMLKELKPIMQWYSCFLWCVTWLLFLCLQQFWKVLFGLCFWLLLNFWMNKNVSKKMIKKRRKKCLIKLNNLINWRLILKDQHYSNMILLWSEFYSKLRQTLKFSYRYINRITAKMFHKNVRNQWIWDFIANFSSIVNLSKDSTIAANNFKILRITFYSQC